jgi:hypothetical protein
MAAGFIELSPAMTYQAMFWPMGEFARKTGNQMLVPENFG